VLELEWSQVIINKPPSQLLNRPVFLEEIGSKLKETAQSWKENNSENLLED